MFQKKCKITVSFLWSLLLPFAQTFDNPYNNDLSIVSILLTLKKKE